MLSVIKTEQDVMLISQLLEKLRSGGYKESVLEEILNSIVLQNPNFPINIILGKSSIPAVFDAEKRKIEISFERLKHYINNIISTTIKGDQYLNKEIFNNYVLLALLHEVEHYNQYLITKKYVEFPYEILIFGYSNLMTLRLSKTINPISGLIKIIRFSFYYNGPDHLLERNANVGSLDLLVKVAKYENNKEMLNVLNQLLYGYLLIGYDSLYNGAMEQTYKKKGIISTYNSFNHSEEIPVKDRVRYGLSIDDETKQKVLKKQFEI